MPSGKSFEISLTGAKEVKAVLARLIARAPQELGGALYREAESIMTSAKAITPVDTGVLKGSGHVQIPKVLGTQVSVELGFGGAASGYAVYVHEDPNARHTPPTQYKYLEQPVRAAESGMLARLAKDLERALK